jgi:hypothetical protein
VVEHGEGEGLFDEGADFSGDAERDLMDGFQGGFVEERFFGASQFQVMDDIEFGFLGGEAGHVVADGDSLVEGFQDGKLHGSSQIGLTGEDQDKGVVGIHLEVGQQAKFFEGTGLEEVGLIDEEKDGFAGAFLGFQEGLLDLAVDGAFGEPGGQAEQTIYML